MNKKIVKIVIVIIFTLLFKLDMVNAADDKNYDCIYSQSGKTVFEGGVKLSVKDGKIDNAYYSKTIHFDRSSKKVEIKDSHQFEKFKRENGCPSNVYLISNWAISDDFDLYINQSSYEKIVSKYRSCITCNLKMKKYASLTFDSSSYKAKNDNGGNAACTCFNADKKFKFEYRAIDYTLNTATLTAPETILGNINSVDKFRYIQNYEKNALVVNGFSKTSVDYNYLSNELKNNVCSPYAIVQKGTVGLSYDYELFFSDEGHKQNYINAMGQNNAVVLNCSPSSEVPTSEPEPEPELEPEDKHYDDPDVNMVVTPLNFSLDTYSCGNGYLESIPVTIPVVGKIVYIIIQILVPVILILLGSFDLVKSVMSQKEDDIKKNQQVFFKRLVSAALIFFVFAIVKFIVSVVSSDNSGDIMDCVDCIIRNSDNCKRE